MGVLQPRNSQQVNKELFQNGCNFLDNFTVKAQCKFMAFQSNLIQVHAVAHNLLLRPLFCPAGARRRHENGVAFDLQPESRVAFSFKQPSIKVSHRSRLTHTPMSHYWVDSGCRS